MVTLCIVVLHFVKQSEYYVITGGEKNSAVREKEPGTVKTDA
jgi:hypothetical protein